MSSGVLECSSHRPEAVCSVSTDCNVVLLKIVYFILDEEAHLHPSPTLWVGTTSGKLCAFHAIFREGAAICSERLELGPTSEQTYIPTDTQYRQTDGRTDRQTDRQTDVHLLLLFLLFLLLLLYLTEFTTEKTSPVVDVLFLNDQLQEIQPHTPWSSQGTSPPGAAGH